ncbi:MAG: restriction endonuclease subunit S [Kofleriaceae bacterium]|nr:restriction endonuclease subunit S [Kofleriaceae bacterium]
MGGDSPIANVAGWPEVALAEITTKIGSGATPRGGSETYLDSRIEYALIRSQNVFDRRFDRDGLAYITNAQADGLRGVVLQRSDVLLNITGDGVTFGRSCIVPEDVRPACVNQHVSIIRVDPEKADAGYVLAFLTHPDVKPYIESFNAGGSRRAITKGHIESFRLPLPPLGEQRAIARIFGALDDKIELNRKMNATLEAMARALFKSWFHEQLEAGGIDEKLVSDLAAVGVLQVGDGYRAKNDEMASEGLPFARAGNIDNGFDFSGADLLGSPGVAKAGDKVSRSCDVVFTSKGTVGRFAFVDPAMQPFVYSPQLCFWRSSNHEALNPFVLRQWMASRWFLDQVDRVKGQTDMAEYVSLRDQRAMRFPLATPESQAAIGTQLAELQRLVWNNERETHTLARIRDDLLPRLLSGELPVDAGERAVEEVA